MNEKKIWRFVASEGPSHVGKYRIVREVGRGGAGLVYEAEDEELRRRVALKVLKRGAEDPELVQRLRREAVIVAQFRHPHIVAIHDVGSFPDAAGQPTHYIAMDFVDGRTLADLQATLDERLRMLEDVARAAAFAHSKGVVHRDLKPSNVLVDANGRVFLTDFGMARAEMFDVRLTHTDAILGTPLYMAPEQVSGRARNADSRTDVYALGVMLYEFLAGAPPFAGDTPAEVFHRILHSDPGRIPAVASDLETICLKALEKDPRRRYQDAGAFADDLARYRRNEPILARPPSLWYRFRKRLARYRLPAVVGVAGLACIAVLAGVLVRQSSRARRERELEEKLRPLEIRVRETRPLFYVEGRDVFARLREIEAMLAEVEGLADRNPDHPRVWSILGIGWYLVGDGVRAERALLRTEDPLARLYLAKIYISRGQAADVPIAGEELDRALGRAYAAMGRREEALRLCADGAARFGRDMGAEEFHLIRAMILEGDERIAACDEALWIRPHFAWARHTRGIALGRKGEWESAVRDFDAAIALYPRMSEAWHGRGQARLALGMFGEARADFDEAIRILPTAEEHLHRGVARFRAGDPAGARVDFDAALRMNPKYAKALVNRARIDGSLRDLEEAERIDPGLSMIHTVRGNVLRAQGKLDDALRSYERVKDDDEALVGSGSIRKSRGELDAALADFDRAIRINPREPGAYFARGQIRFARKNYAAALEDFDAAVRLRPDGESYNARGATRALIGEWGAAFSDFTEAIRIDASDASAWKNRGNARRLLKDLAGALSDLDEALRLRPEWPEALYNRSLVHASAGRAKPAVEDLERALRLAPSDWPWRAEAEKLRDDIK